MHGFSCCNTINSQYVLQLFVGLAGEILAMYRCWKIKESNLNAVKAPTIVTGRQTHAQACVRLASAVFLSLPLPSLWDGDLSIGVRRRWNGNSTVIVLLYRKVGKFIPIDMSCVCNVTPFTIQKFALLKLCLTKTMVAQEMCCLSLFCFYNYYMESVCFIEQAQQQKRSVTLDFSIHARYGLLSGVETLQETGNSKDINMKSPASQVTEVSFYLCIFSSCYW